MKTKSEPHRLASIRLKDAYEQGHHLIFSQMAGGVK